MAFKRHVQLMEDTDTNVVFNIAVRDAADQFTYGNKTITLSKPFNYQQLQAIVRNTVRQIVEAVDTPEGALRSIVAQENEAD